MGAELWKKAVLLFLINVVFGRTTETKTIQQRIVSGEPAQSGFLPWQVILMEDEYDVLECGGSIIGKRWILTAAHCFDKMQSVFIVIGTINLRDYTYNMTSTKIFIHPEYDRLTYRNDIALVKLPRSLKYSKDVQPIKLPSRLQAAYSFVDSKAIISGFGYSDDYILEVSEVLMWAEVEIIENGQCAAALGDDKVLETNICAKGEGDSNKSICTGDSGGALVAEVNHKPVQIGINSFVRTESCTKKYPSVYTKTSAYLDYISKITGIKFV